MDNFISSTIQIALTALLSAVLFYFIKPKKGSEAQPLLNGDLLKPNLFYLIFPLILFIALFGLSIAYFFDKDPTALILLIVFALIICPFGTYMLKVYYTHRLFYTEEKIAVTHWRGEIKTALWSEIQSAKYNQNKGTFVLKTNTASLNIHPFMNGMPNFLNTLVEKSGVDRKALQSQFVKF